MFSQRSGGAASVERRGTPFSADSQANVSAPVSNQRAIPTLDGLRALSIGTVLLAHASNGLRIGLAFDPFAPHELGKIGVRIFFVISGYLITTLLVRERQQTGRISLSRFYARRAFRILPAYYVFLAFVAAVALVRPSVGISRHSLLLNAVYLSNWNFAPGSLLLHLWSLGLEEQFYLLWPFVLTRRDPARCGRLLSLALLAGIVVRGLAVAGAPGAWRPAAALFLGSDGLVLGCGLAIWRDRLHAASAYVKLRGVVAALALPLIALFTMIDHTRFFFVFGILLESLVLALFVDWCIANPASRVGTMLEHPAMRLVGRWSYSLYLWHVLWTVVALTGAPWARVPLMLTAVLFSYYVVEQPMLRVRDHLRLLRQATATS